ncbi:uncharacterized protein DS421_6g182240 [Arachis hypogaea]|nr:uncharacterized protein DS421_6g182240 [Arachis hypogaea]
MYLLFPLSSINWSSRKYKRFFMLSSSAAQSENFSGAFEDFSSVRSDTGSKIQLEDADD